MRKLLGTLALTAAALAASGSAPAASSSLELTPVGRLPFPERGYVVDLPGRATIDPKSVRVVENGRVVRDVDVSPVAAAGIHFGVVLAIDASESMTGAPLAAAVDAARTFVDRRETDQEVGIIAFNGDVLVLQATTKAPHELERALATPPKLAYGTRIYDAVDESLALLARARLSSGSIVLLSDGADIGSQTDIDRVIEKARGRHVRIFAVGLRSGAFDPAALRRLADATGGTFAEASSPRQLTYIYDALGRRLASEYVVRYRSDAAPRSHVDVSISFSDLGRARTRYVAPTPAGLRPYHRSLASRFVASPAAPFALSLVIAALAGLAIVVFVRPRRSTLVERVRHFAGWEGSLGMQDAPGGLAGARPVRSGALGKFDRTLEIARIEISATRILVLTVLGTLLVMAILIAIAPIFAVLGLLTPLLPRALVLRKLRLVRDEFADQLAPNLQVLASALRTGHSFIGALTVVVENAHEPSQSELRRALADEKLGVPVEDAVRRVADRMASRDLEQVALLAELQRTAGGNAAEVLDTVVETMRDRADIRRLVRTLTAQGRMARWILSALPSGAALLLWAIQPNAIVPMFTTGVGQVLLTVAAVLVVMGSLVIQKIVDIKV